jgi:hypothetical protein
VAVAQFEPPTQVLETEPSIDPARLALDHAQVAEQLPARPGVALEVRERTVDAFVSAPPRLASALFPESTRGARDAQLLFLADRLGFAVERVARVAYVAELGEWIREGRKLRADSWVGYNSFRHTCATVLFRRG